MKNYKIYTLDDIDYWKDDFDKALLKIEKSSDPKRINYTKENFDIYEQTDLCVLYDDDNNLVAFSSVYSSDCYPTNCYRILNRFWKDDLVRWNGYVSITMVRHQLDVLHNLNARCGFISTEGIRSRWLKNWIDRAVLKGFDFKQINGMAKVCNGNYKSCWQNVGYIMIDNTKPPPEFEVMDYDVWMLRTDYE